LNLRRRRGHGPEDLGDAIGGLFQSALHAGREVAVVASLVAFIVLASRDEPRALEHLQVLGDGRQAHVERRCELLDRRLSLGETLEDRAPRCQTARGTNWLTAVNVI
jgi:hypothetical protein